MERTELREQFFAEVRSDPYAHMLTRQLSMMWVEGYEKALRDAEAMLTAAYHDGSIADAGYPEAAERVEDLRRSKSFSDRCDDAVEFMTDDRKKAEAQAIIALATMGAMLPWPRKPRS